MPNEVNAAIRKLVDLFTAADMPVTYFDPVRKVFVLVVGGEQAPAYEKVLKAVQDFASSESQRAIQQIAAAMLKDKQS